MFLKRIFERLCVIFTSKKSFFVLFFSFLQFVVITSQQSNPYFALACLNYLLTVVKCIGKSLNPVYSH